MNNEKDIEKKIAEKLSSRKFEIKPEWEDDINSRLDEYNRSKKRIVALVLVLSTIVSIVAAIWIFNDSNPKNIPNQKPQLTSPKHTPANTDKKTANNTIIAPAKKNNAKLEEKEQSQTTKKEQHLTSEQTTTSTPLDVSYLKNTSTAPVPSSKTEITTPEQTTPATTIPKKENTNTKEEATPPMEQIQDSISTDNTSNTQNQPDSSINQADTTIQSNNTTTNNQKKKNSQWELGLVIGPTMAFKKQSEHESPARYFDLKLSLSNRLGNNLRYNTGINYTSYGENLKYKPLLYQISDTSLQYNNYIETLIDSQFDNNSQRWIYDTTYIPRTDTITTISQVDKEDKTPLAANGKTKFTYIEVPLRVSFPFVNKPRYTLNLTAGGSIGFLVKSTGSYYRDKTIIKAQSQKIIYNALLGTSLDYDIGNNLNFRTQAMFKRNLNNLSSISTSAKRYTSFDLQAGLVYKF